MPAALATAVHPAPRTVAAATSALAAIAPAGRASAPVTAIASLAPVAALAAIPSLPAAGGRRPVARRRDDRAAPAQAVHLAGPELADRERVQRRSKELAGPRDRVFAALAHELVGLIHRVVHSNLLR